MTTFTPNRRVREGRIVFNAPPETVFPLLCPVREYDWIDVWDCRLIYTASGVAEIDGVFMTDFAHHGGAETWVVSRYEPPRAIEFVRFSPAEKVVRLAVALVPLGPGRTEATWKKVFTGLSDAGNRFIDTAAGDLFDMEVARIETLLNHFLDTGAMLTGIALPG
ncbi:MAG: SRPBCC family protein [Pseudomonadota bacterium]